MAPSRPGLAAQYENVALPVDLGLLQQCRTHSIGLFLVLAFAADVREHGLRWLINRPTLAFPQQLHQFGNNGFLHSTPVTLYLSRLGRWWTDQWSLFSRPQQAPASGRPFTAVWSGNFSPRPHPSPTPPTASYAPDRPFRTVCSVPHSPLECSHNLMSLFMHSPPPSRWAVH